MNYSLYKIEDFLTDESFIKYCLREDPEVLKYWEGVLTNQPELAETMRQAESLFMVLSLKIDPEEKQYELEKLKRSIEGTAVDIEEDNIQIVRFKPIYGWLSAAASILICIGIYWGLNRVDYSKHIPVYAQIGKTQTIKTKFNERRTVTLPDGSTILLNGQTELRIDPDYNKNNRVLWLSGEAFFTVVKNREKPFIVISGKLATTALGTSFKINNYSRNPETSVMLTSGKVNIGMVTNDKVVNHMVLMPGEMVVAKTENHQLSKRMFNIQEVEDWNNRKLMFSMASLEEIRTVLNNVYGVVINSKNLPKKPIAFTGEFNNSSLVNVLDAIGFSNHFTYTIEEDNVMLIFEK